MKQFNIEILKFYIYKTSNLGNCDSAEANDTNMTSNDGSTNQNRFITVVALVGLVAVQTLVAIIYKLAQTNGKYAFSTASALTMAEFIKIWLSFGLHTRTTGWKNTIPELREHIKKAPYFQIAGLAFSYFVNNHLNFYLFLWADPVSITVMKSGASFITAILSWIVLARFISRVQWSAILLQVAGLCLLQYDPCRNSTTLELNGYFIMFISVSIASANGIWNERLLKSYDCSLNVQNMMLYTSGTVFNFILFLVHSNEIGFFEGYNVPAIIVVFLNAVIGLTITVIYKYTNAIAKTFCSAVATVVLFIVNATLFNTPATLNSILSCIVVFVATYLYTQSAADNSKPKEYNKLPTSQLDVEEPAPSKSCLGFLSARRIGAVIFGALMITSVVISIQTVKASSSALIASNSTIKTPIAVFAPTASASSELRIGGVVSPPSSEFFDDILVIIHFHSPHFRHLPVILGEYGKVFKNIVICAQKKADLVDYVCTKDQITGGGHFMYTCVADIMEAYPNFKGYMAFHFDVIINYWNFPSFDKTKPWISLTADNTGPYPINKYTQDNWPDDWGWWGSEYGVVACKEAVKEYTAEDKNKMGKAWGFQDGMYRGMGDLYYIPRVKTTEYSRLARMFQRNKVFLEIAVPTIASLIDFPAYPTNITGVYDWSYLGGWDQARSWSSIYLTNLHFVHPYPWFKDTAYEDFRKMMQFGYTAK